MVFPLLCGIAYWISSADNEMRNRDEDRANEGRERGRLQTMLTSYLVKQTLQSKKDFKKYMFVLKKKVCCFPSATPCFNFTRPYWELPSTIAVFYWCHKELHRLYLVMTQIKTEVLFIRDYVVVRRLIPSGCKRLGLTFISDLLRQRQRGLKRQGEYMWVCLNVCMRACVFLLPKSDSSSSLCLFQQSPLENMHRYNCPFVKHQTSAIFLT